MPWDIVFYKAADESVPTDDFLDACPVKVRAQLLAALRLLETAKGDGSSFGRQRDVRARGVLPPSGWRRHSAGRSDPCLLIIGFSQEHILKPEWRHRRPLLGASRSRSTADSELQSELAAAKTRLAD